MCATKNYIMIFPLLITPFFLSNRKLKSAHKQSTIVETRVRDNWSGTVTWIKTSVSKGEKKWDEAGKQNVHKWNYSAEFKINATFVNGRGTVTRSEKTTNRDNDKLIFVPADDKYMIVETSTIITCDSSDVLELSVEFSEDTLGRKVYWITLATPACNEILVYTKNNNILGVENNQSMVEKGGGQLILPANASGQLLGNDPNILTGSFRELIPAPPDGGSGEILTIASWNLTRGTPKPELLVTPYSDDADYDNWMPEPGLNESIKGNDLNIELHLQDIGGGISSVKAKWFELRLVNTSKQPGVCINTPLTPSGLQPDLRFLSQPGATVSPDGQFIRIPCEDGENGEAVIGSYDGGGWTILTAKAILENGNSADGVLSQDKSKKDIPIPKNFSGGKIAERWLDDNGNPGETNDDETTAGNNHNGDGLSAYEEYRGVFSEGNFKRLDPKEKELGVKFKKSDINHFNDGMKKFESVTGFRIIRFHENEIAASRRINQNGAYAQVYKQFVLHLVTGTLPSNISARALGGPGIPAHVSSVMIDLNNNHQSYLDRRSNAARMLMSLSYSEKQLLDLVVAHELVHGIDVSHHGPGPDPPIILNHRFDINSNPAGRIFDFNGNAVSLPYTVTGQTGLPGNQQSGDLGCIMALNFLCEWVAHETTNLTMFYEVPILPLGHRLCTSKTGTGINAGGKYFGDATTGKCIELLKLK